MSRQAVANTTTEVAGWHGNNGSVTAQVNVISVLVTPQRKAHHFLRQRCSVFTSPRGSQWIRRLCSNVPATESARALALLVEPSSGGPGDPSLIWGSVRFVRTHARDHDSALDARPDRDHPTSTIKKPGRILPLALRVPP